MRLVRIAAIFITVMMAAFLLVSVPPAQGAPAADGSLNNPGFEAFTKSNVEPDWNGVANGWTPWWTTVGDGSCPSEPSGNYYKPKYEQEMHGTHVHGGQSSGRVYVAYHVADGGYYQQVASTAGSTYQFSAWAFLWSSENPIVDSPSDGPTMSFQVGIDPAGGTSPGAVHWSGGGNTMDTFVQQSISAVATGGQISVWVRATSQYCVARNDAFFDDSAVTVTATGPAPGATAAPGSTAKPPTPKPSGDWGACNGCIPTVTPGPDGSIIHTVGPGQTCIGIATAYGIGLDTLEKLNNLTNASCKFISVGVKLTIKPAGSGGGSSGGSTGGGSDATPEATEAPAEPTIAPTEAPQTGTICVLGYEDTNGNGLREVTEPNSTGMTFTVTGAAGPVANYTTDGSAEPHCFTQLAAGDYTVNWEGDGFTPSPAGSDSWPVTVAGGSSASHNFGATTGAGGGSSGGSTTGGNTNTTNDSTGLPTWAIALIGAFGVILFMGGLGVAGYFLLLRRTNI